VRRLRPLGIGRGAAIFAAGVALGAAGLAFAAGGVRLTQHTGKTPVYSTRPTGVGLPRIGADGTVGAGDFASALRSYHDGGGYEHDLKTVDGRARDYLARRLRQIKRHPGARQKKPAMVLDIDETSLSNYSYLEAANFSGTIGALAAAVAAANDPPIRPTLKLYNYAKRHGVAVFFITGRPGGIPFVETNTEANLTSAGYSGWKGLTLNSTGLSTVPYKSGRRAAIQRKYDIIVNVGDQESDLQGGHADRAYKLPNPFYFIGR
jgi:putative acid phosphatase of HAD superfamily subfamily IIIB